jgi:hypothetical protein
LLVERAGNPERTNTFGRVYGGPRESARKRRSVESHPYVGLTRRRDGNPRIITERAPDKMIPTGKIPISREQVENAVKFLKAEISIREIRLATMKAEGAAWRCMHDTPGDRNTSQSRLTQKWQEAHRAKEDAESQFQELELMKLKSQLAIQEAMLNDGENNDRQLISRLT